MKKLLVAFVAVILTIVPTAISARENADPTYPVWYGDKVKMLTVAEIETIVQNGSLYVVAFDDLIMDLGWKAVTEGVTYKVNGLSDGRIRITNDINLRHWFAFEPYYGQSYANWLTLHYFDPKGH